MQLTIEIEVQDCDGSDINVTNQCENLTLEIIDAPMGGGGDASIDDSAGIGDTDVTWSADKSARELADKVDKEDGMGLSELSFTTDDKLSLDQSEQDRHTHNNKTVIDDLSDDSGVLQYKGLPISDQAALDAKVDKVAGKGLSDENYTLEEKNKLAGLESSRFKGVFTSLANLQDGVTAPQAGDYADVDAGVGDDVVRFIWDATDSAWVVQQSATTITAAQVKQMYESNPDTNVFDDDEKCKLATVQENATANRADSENADKIHGHAISDVTGLDAELLTKFDKADIVQVTGPATDKVMSQKAVTELISQYMNQFMPWNPSALFMRGESGLWYKPSIMSTLFQSSSGETPVVSIGDPVGLMLDRSGNDNHATQAASSFRPTYTLDPSGAPVLLGDGVDDAMTTPPAAYSGTSYINTSYGWYKSSVQEGVAASLPLTWLREYVAREGSASVADDDKMRSYFATEQKFMIVMARNLVINNLIMFSDGNATTVVAIGDNGATAEKQLSLNASQTWDLSAEGLTAPVLLVFDSNTALVSFQCYPNQLTGHIPDLSSNTSLLNFRCHGNQLTGSIPDLSPNTALVYFYCQTNQLTGSIPDLSSNTALIRFYCDANKLTGWSGGSVSNTLVSFSAANNLLTQTTVDGLLVAFDAAGSATGYFNLGGTNSTPSETGKTAADNLRAKGWTVTLNGY